MKDWTQLIPPVLVVIATFLLVTWANGREHQARVNGDPPFQRAYQAGETLNRHWLDETNPDAKRRGYPANRRFQ